MECSPNNKLEETMVNKEIERISHILCSDNSISKPYIDINSLIELLMGSELAVNSDTKVPIVWEMWASVMLNRSLWSQREGRWKPVPRIPRHKNWAWRSYDQVRMRPKNKIQQSDNWERLAATRPKRWKKKMRKRRKLLRIKQMNFLILLLRCFGRFVL